MNIFLYIYTKKMDYFRLKIDFRFLQKTLHASSNSVLVPDHKQKQITKHFKVPKFNPIPHYCPENLQYMWRENLANSD